MVACPSCVHQGAWAGSSREQPGLWSNSCLMDVEMGGAAHTGPVPPPAPAQGQYRPWCLPGLGCAQGSNLGVCLCVLAALPVEWEHGTLPWGSSWGKRMVPALVSV